jgi:hypothetical protein
MKVKGKKLKYIKTIDSRYASGNIEVSYYTRRKDEMGFNIYKTYRINVYQLLPLIQKHNWIATTKKVHTYLTKEEEDGSE